MQLLKRLLLPTVVCALVGAPSMVFAKEKILGTNSFMTCGFGALPGTPPVVNGGYGVLAHTTPPSIDTSQCVIGANPSLCNPCITSLKNQGCKVLDIVTDQFGDVTNSRSGAMVTFLLSCR